VSATVDPASRESGGKQATVQGVYILKEDHGKQRAIFVPVTTGVTGATDIEVTSGLNQGQTIVTGLYRVLRTLKSGTAVKPDNSTPAASTTT
jgi:HlyD family secretion protein